MKAIIIEDEAHSRNALKDALDGKVELLGEADGLQSGIRLIRSVNPELVFLDIELKDGQGFDLFSEVPLPEFQVIFTTAYSKYAVKAFRFSALDYLLKPIDPDELDEALEKAVQQKMGSSFSSQIDILKNALSASDDLPGKIVLKNIDAVHVVRVDSIIWCHAEGSYTNFRLRDGREILVSKNLREYEKLLHPYGFRRIHRSYILQIDFIIKFNNLESTILVDGNNTLPTSLTKESFLKIISH